MLSIVANKYMVEMPLLLSTFSVLMFMITQAINVAFTVVLVVGKYEFYPGMQHTWKNALTASCSLLGATASYILIRKFFKYKCTKIISLVAITTFVVIFVLEMQLMSSTPIQFTLCRYKSDKHINLYRSFFRGHIKFLPITGGSIYFGYEHICLPICENIYLNVQ